MQDTHRQKHWSVEQKEAASRDAGNQQPERVSRDRQVADHQPQGQPSSANRENTDGHGANGYSSDSVAQRAKILKQDAQALTGAVRESAELVQRYVSEQVEQRPYSTVAIAAGVGFVLGGGLANRISSATFGAVYRVALALAARELSARISAPGVGDDSSRRQQSPQ